MKATTSRILLVIVAVSALVLSGCQPPTAEEVTEAETAGGEAAGTEAPAGGATDNTAALEEVYAAVEGLTGEERASTLAELAADEPTLNVYGSTNLDDAGPLFDEFADLYDLEPSYYRASSSDVLQRVTQENDAGFAGNDVVMANGPEMALFDQEGLLAPLNSPATGDIIEAGVFDTWASIYMNTFIGGWNTNAQTESLGEDWVEFLENFDGQLAMELGDWDWFATLTKQYLIPEKGMTEDEVVEMFTQAARSARVVDGHTLMAELLVAGEFDAATSLYHHRVAEFISEGAPLAWEPPVRPLVIRPNGIGIMKSVQAPATALLWTEYVLTRGQEIFAENFRGPASTAVEGGLPDEYEPILVDIEAVTTERDKWEGLWASIVEASGTEPLVEE